MKVMVVDDEPSIVRTYKALLQRAGHEVVGTATDGVEAVELYRALLATRRPDVVLMDHRMPVKDGVSACRDIIAIDPAAKIIIATADASVREQAFAAGAARFNLKPFTPAVLYASLESVVGAAGTVQAAK